MAGEVPDFLGGHSEIDRLMQGMSHPRRALQAASNVEPERQVSMGPFALIGSAAPKVEQEVLKLGGAFGKLAAVPFNAAVSGLNGIGQGLHAMQGELGPVGIAFDAMRAGARGAKAALDVMPEIVKKIGGPFVDAAEGAINAIDSITRSLVAMTRLSSPGTFRLWEYALTDSQAVIGHSFTPVLELMTEEVRLFGDALASVLPNTEETRRGLAPLAEAMKEFNGAARDALKELGPSIRVFLVASLYDLSAILKVTAYQVTVLTRSLEGQARIMNALTGQKPEARSSYGAAARPATFMSDESYLNKIYEGAFSLPAQGAKPEERTATAAEKILNWLEKHDPGGIGKMAADAVLPGAREAAWETNTAIKIRQFLGF